MGEIRAAGFVVFRRGEGRHLYLNLKNAKHGDVGVPKGHTEPGEDDWTTALRETAEETGLTGDRLRPLRAFRREITYPVKKGDKRVVYFAAEALTGEIEGSDEHDKIVWRDLHASMVAMKHASMRSIISEAATFLKDPLLQHGLEPEEAQDFLRERVGADAPLMGHVAEVAAMARTIAEAWGEEVDPDYVEAAAWLHDVGRARTHGIRHPIEGFKLMCEEGWPGYAPCCVSHYSKGKSEGLCDDAALEREMQEACDLTTFEPEERIVALADFLAAGERRVSLAERHADLVKRYGPSKTFDDNLAICRKLKAEFESRTGASLYSMLDIG